MKSPAQIGCEFRALESVKSRRAEITEVIVT
jgi:hypothetical protein